MLKLILDIILSFVLIILLLPLFILVSIAIVLTSKGGPFFCQQRVGKNGKIFTLYKFRTMKVKQSHQSLLTVGNDERITAVGKWLRKSKIDELPQLINILKCDMSFVGPRPEVPYYVQFYTNEQRKVLTVRPGLTDIASLSYINESEELSKAQNPEEHYIKVILPKKIELSLQYIEKQTFISDLGIILKTFLKITRICK